MSLDNRLFSSRQDNPSRNPDPTLSGSSKLSQTLNLSRSNRVPDKKLRNGNQLNASKSTLIKRLKFEKTKKLAKSIRSKRSFKPKHLARQLGRIKRKKLDQINNQMADHWLKNADNRVDQSEKTRRYLELNSANQSYELSDEVFAETYSWPSESPREPTNQTDNQTNQTRKSKDSFDPLNLIMRDSQMKSQIKSNSLKTGKCSLKLPSILERSSSSTISEKETGRTIRFGRANEPDDKRREESDCKNKSRSMQDSLVIDLDRIDSELANQYRPGPGHLMSYFSSMKHLLENGLDRMEKSGVFKADVDGSPPGGGGIMLSSKRFELTGRSSALRDKKVVLIKPTINESCARLGHLNNKAIMSFRGALCITKNFYPENHWAWIVCLCTVCFHLLNFVVSMNGLSLWIGHLLFEQRYTILTSLSTSHLKCIDINNYFVLDRMNFHSNQSDREADRAHHAAHLGEPSRFSNTGRNFSLDSSFERQIARSPLETYTRQTNASDDQSKELMKRLLFDYGLVYLPSSTKQTEKFLAYADFEHFTKLNAPYLNENGENFPYNQVSFWGKDPRIRLENLIKLDELDVRLRKFDKSGNRDQAISEQNNSANNPTANNSNVNLPPNEFSHLNAIKVRLNQLEQLLLRWPPERGEQQRLLNEKKYLEREFLENLKARSGDNCAAIWFGNLVKSIESGRTLSNSQIMFHGMGMLLFH